MIYAAAIRRCKWLSVSASGPPRNSHTCRNSLSALRLDHIHPCAIMIRSRNAELVELFLKSSKTTAIANVCCSTISFLFVVVCFCCAASSICPQHTSFNNIATAGVACSATHASAHANEQRKPSDKAQVRITMACAMCAQGLPRHLTMQALRPDLLWTKLPNINRRPDLNGRRCLLQQNQASRASVRKWCVCSCE